MNQKNISDVITVLKCLLEHHYKCFNDRRSYHWKMNFFIWGGIFALTIALIRTENYPPLWVSITIAFIFLIIYIFIWMPGLKKAHATNKEYYQRYDQLLRDQLRNANLNLPTHDEILEKVTCSKIGNDWIKYFPKCKIWFDWSAITEIFITILIISGSVFLLRDP